jgi:hypothetical protein
MAIVRAPFFGISATDSLGKAITFSRWKGRAYVRTLVKPKNPRSGLQVGMRSGVAFMSKNFKSLTAGQVANWKLAAKVGNVTPLNAQVRLNQTRVRQGFGVLRDPTLAAGAVEAAPTGVTATALPKAVKLAWTDSVGASDYCTFIYMGTAPGFTNSTATLIAIIFHGVQVFTKIRLTTGTTYYFHVGGCEAGGTLGTVAAEVSAVVL